MFLNIVKTLVGAAIVVSGPALAGPGGGGGHGGGGGPVGMRGGFGAAMGPSMSGPSHVGINSRVNSQGMVNASSRGILRSNTRSALPAHATRVRGPPSHSLIHPSLTPISHASPTSALPP